MLQLNGLKGLDVEYIIFIINIGYTNVHVE